MFRLGPRNALRTSTRRRQRYVPVRLGRSIARLLLKALSSVTGSCSTISSLNIPAE